MYIDFHNSDILIEKFCKFLNIDQRLDEDEDDNPLSPKNKKVKKQKNSLWRGDSFIKALDKKQNKRKKIKHMTIVWMYLVYSGV